MCKTDNIEETLEVMHCLKDVKCSTNICHVLKYSILSTSIKEQNQWRVSVSKLLVQAVSHAVHDDLSEDADNGKPFSTS
jgi:hypothetical protein